MQDFYGSPRDNYLNPWKLLAAFQRMGAKLPNNTLKKEDSKKLMKILKVLNQQTLKNFGEKM